MSEIIFIHKSNAICKHISHFGNRTRPTKKCVKSLQSQRRKIGFKKFPNASKNKKQQADRNHTSTQQGFCKIAGEVLHFKNFRIFEMSASLQS